MKITHPLVRKAVDEMNSFFQEEGALAMESGLLNYKALRGIHEFNINTKIPENIEYWTKSIAKWEKANRQKLTGLQKQFKDNTRGLIKHRLN